MDRALARDFGKMAGLFRQGRAHALKRLSFEASREAALSWDRRRAQVAVLAYALYKLLSKHHIVSNPAWRRARKRIVERIERARELSRERDPEAFLGALGEITDAVVEVDTEIGRYAQNAYQKARVKVASTAYALGLSLSRSAALTGAPLKDVLSYVGFTRIHEDTRVTKTMARRVEELRGLMA